MKSTVSVSRLAAALCALLFAVSAFAPVARAEPTEVGTMLPAIGVPRAGSGVAIGDDGLVYIFGGWGDYWAFGVTLDTVVIYDPSTGETDYGPDMPVGVGGAACTKGDDGNIYVFGGYNTTLSGYYGGLQIYDVSDETWTTDTSMPEFTYMSTAAAAEDGRLFVIGGWISSIGPVNYTLVYDPSDGSWDYGADIPTRRWMPTALTIGESAIMVAGGEDMALTYDLVDIYDPTTDTWTSAAPMNEVKKSVGLAMGRNGCVYALGGSNEWAWPTSGPTLDTIERYDPVEDEWTVCDLSLTQPTAFGGTVVTSSGYILVVGGYSSTTTLTSVEAILPLEVTALRELMIASPAQGSVVSGVVEVEVVLKNGPELGLMAVDLVVDGVLHETQSGGLSWTFLWDTSALPDKSVHTVVARGYDWDMSIVEASVTVTVWSDSFAEKIKELEGMIADLTAMMDEANATQAEELEALNELLSDLQAQLVETDDTVESLEDKADSANMLAMVGLILAIVAIAIAVLVFIMGRKKAA